MEQIYSITRYDINDNRNEVRSKMSRRTQLLILSVTLIMLISLYTGLNVITADVDSTNIITPPSPTSTDSPPMNACIWTWTLQELPRHTMLLRAGAVFMGLRDQLSDVSVFAFGENCTNQALGTTQFAAMQTDFTINLSYDALPQDEGELHNLIGDTAYSIVNVLALPVFSPEQTPGPNSGQIIIRFTLDNDGITTTAYQLVANWDDAMTTLADDLQGVEMVESLGGIQ